MRRPGGLERAGAAGPPVDPDVPERAPATARRRAHHVLRERWDILLVIAAGGALGSLARWALTASWPTGAHTLPWATGVENVSGAFLLGLLMVFVLDVWPARRYLRPFLGVGVLGGYTTFSTYMLDTHALLARGDAAQALLYLFGTLVLGLGAVWAGVLLARTGLALSARRRRRAARRRTRRDPTADHRDLDGHPGSNTDAEQRSSR